MKHVQVFRLGEPTTVAIPNGTREIQCHIMNGCLPVPLIGGEHHYALPLTETITCPVYCLKHAVKGSLKGAVPENIALEYEWDRLSDTWVRTRYIAMEPGLFNMFDTAVRQPYEEREQVRAARLAKSEEQVSIIKRAIDNFWAMPWYKRVWFAITRDC